MSKATVELICAEFDVEIIPAGVYPQPGQTRAVATMAAILRKYGEGHFRLVLTTLSETRGNDALIDETSLWATSDLIRACPDWVENRTSEWLEWWDRIPLGPILATINQLRGKVHQRHALAGALYIVLTTYSKERMANQETNACLARRIPEYKGKQKLRHERAVAIGRKLLSVKASLPHGEFMGWVERDSGMSYAAASRYLTIAKHEGA